MKDWKVLIICLVVIVGSIGYGIFHKSKLEKIVKDIGFQFYHVDDGAYAGYYYEMDKEASEYCNKGKEASVYTNVRSYIGNKIYYYCSDNSDNTYEFEYDVDDKQLNFVEDSSMYAEPLILNPSESAKYQKIFDTEFKELNDDINQKYDVHEINFRAFVE